MNKKAKGFTLIELMIVVAIVALISVIAYPSYMNYVINTKRNVATNTLLQIADRQQQFFMDNKRYAATLTDLGLAANPLILDEQGNPADAGNTRTVYAVSLSDITATTYTITAAPVNMQLKRDTKCGSLTLNQAGTQGASTGYDGCW